MTPEQRYTKARRIPPSEWDWLRDYPVELNNIRFYDGEIRIDTQHGGEILISPDDVDADTVEKLIIESFIDHYAPEVELVWEESRVGVGDYLLELTNNLFKIQVYEMPDGWGWQLFFRTIGSHCLELKGGFETEAKASSNAKAAAGELIKGVLKPG